MISKNKILLFNTLFVIIISIMKDITINFPFLDKSNGLKNHYFTNLIVNTLSNSNKQEQKISQIAYIFKNTVMHVFYIDDNQYAYDIPDKIRFLPLLLKSFSPYYQKTALQHLYEGNFKKDHSLEDFLYLLKDIKPHPEQQITLRNTFFSILNYGLAKEQQKLTLFLNRHSSAEFTDKIMFSDEEMMHYTGHCCFFRYAKNMLTDLSKEKNLCYNIAVNNIYKTDNTTNNQKLLTFRDIVASYEKVPQSEALEYANIQAQVWDLNTSSKKTSTVKVL